jgi:phosphoribosylanthranilate isomerase
MRLSVMIVQIYEVRTPEEAGALARLGVDHIGVLVGNGAFPRELTADRASAVFAALPARAQRVALSLSADPAEIARVVEQTRPDIIHIGAAVELFLVRDTQALKAAFPDVRIMRAIPIIDEASIECANDYRGIADFLLLDSARRGGIVI